jgi:hypothetical protein
LISPSCARKKRIRKKAIAALLTRVTQLKIVLWTSRFEVVMYCSLIRLLLSDLRPPRLVTPLDGCVELPD